MPIFKKDKTIYSCDFQANHIKSQIIHNGYNYCTKSAWVIEKNNELRGNVAKMLLQELITEWRVVEVLSHM